MIQPQDTKIRFKDKLYGRSKEFNQLLEIYDNQKSQRNNLVLINGVSGIGKSAFVNSFAEHKMEESVIFVSGKQDLSRDNPPYTAIIQSFNQLIEEWIIEAPAKIDEIRTAISEEAGNNLPILIKTFPRLMQFFDQLEIKESSLVNNYRDRFNEALLSFTRIVNRINEKVIVFKRPEWFQTSFNIGFALLVLLLVRSVRRAIVFLLNQVRSFLHLLPGKSTKELLARYEMMAKFAIYGRQRNIYSRLKRQYPQGSHFIILAMDMAYMGAGSLDKSEDYYHQLQELAELNRKDEVHPFVFVDPRRIRDMKHGKTFFDFKIDGDKIKLKDSIIKRFIEDEKFSGFKIYPALGYFPFDEDLLPLWKYAADNEIPIMSHGVKGVIYYRGTIKRDWNYHPVFTEFLGENGHVPLAFYQFKNSEFQTNFTHPMNFLCLLEEPLLRKLIGEGKSDLNKELFSYTDSETPLKSNLSNLKICYAHYGGAVEWNKFLARDRDNYAQQLMAKPKEGISFGRETTGKMPWGRFENVWKYTDWYSIVSSMMIQYENFYADISYVVSDPKLYPMLRSTISSGLSIENDFTAGLTYESKEKLRNRVLFGTDFYVVRSQKSDKDIFIELKSYLTEDEFDLIARENPHEYLKRKYNS